MEAASPDRPTRERVLDAGLALFAQRGFEATSLDAIAAELGVRKQTVLYYHPSKEALLGAVIDRAASEFGSALVAARRGAAGVLDEVLRLGAERPELLALVREVVRLGVPHSSHLLAGLEPLLQRAATTVPEHRLVVAAAMVVGMATEVEVLRAAGVEPDLAWLRRRRRSVLAEIAS